MEIIEDLWMDHETQHERKLGFSGFPLVGLLSLGNANITQALGEIDLAFLGRDWETLPMLRCPEGAKEALVGGNRGNDSRLFFRFLRPF